MRGMLLGTLARVLGRSVAWRVHAGVARFNVRCPKGTTPPSGLTWPAQKVEVAVFFEEQKGSGQSDRGGGSAGWLAVD